MIAITRVDPSLQLRGREASLVYEVACTEVSVTCSKKTKQHQVEYCATPLASEN